MDRLRAFSQTFCDNGFSQRPANQKLDFFKFHLITVIDFQLLGIEPEQIRRMQVGWLDIKYVYLTAFQLPNGRTPPSIKILSPFQIRSFSKKILLPKFFLCFSVSPCLCGLNAFWPQRHGDTEVKPIFILSIVPVGRGG